MLEKKRFKVNFEVRYHVCIVSRCNKKQYRNGYCMKHKQALYRERNAIKWAYINFKHTTRMRHPGADFNITLEEFSAFVTEHNALKMQWGRRVYDIVRITPDGGFNIANLRAIEKDEAGRRSQTLRKNNKPIF